MGWKLIIVACCMLQPSRGQAMSRQDISDFVEYIERTSRPDRRIILKEGPSDSESAEEDEGNAWEDGDKFEGDMILNRRQRYMIIQDVISGGTARNGYKNLSRRWPKNQVIYSIRREHFSREQRKHIENAIQILANASCVNFKKYKKGDKHSVVVEGKGNGCHSYIGFQAIGHQVLNLSAKNKVGTGCLKTGTIIHEFLHALGFFHMHCNPNRDKYVRVHWENICPDKRSNFLKYRSDEITDFGVEYEYYSIMHYSRKARSINGKDTIEPLKDNTFNKAQRDAMTDRDIRKLNLMYCDKKKKKVSR